MGKRREPESEQRLTRRLLTREGSLILGRTCEQSGLLTFAALGTLYLGTIVNPELARSRSLDLALLLAMIDLRAEIFE
jgi:hypothetical protein